MPTTRSLSLSLRTLLRESELNVSVVPWNHHIVSTVYSTCQGPPLPLLIELVYLEGTVLSLLLSLLLYMYSTLISV